MEISFMDPEWISKVRKTWKGYVKKSVSVSGKDAEKFLQNGIDWIDAVSHDLSYSKGFFVHDDVHPHVHTRTYKAKLKFLGLLQESKKELKEGKIEISFWRDLMTPGTKHWEFGEHSHRIPTIKEKFHVQSEDVNNWVKENKKKVVKEFLLPNYEEIVKDTVKRVDKIFSKSFLGGLTKFVNDWGGGKLKTQSFDREFSIGDVKVVMIDRKTPFPTSEESEQRHPSLVLKYVDQLRKAKAFLEREGLGFLWYGTFFISCRSCGGRNQYGSKWGVGANYHFFKDVVTIFSDPYKDLYLDIIHELGHRYYFKFMTSTDRARFNASFNDVPAVSEYGGTSPEEDFAEVFSHYLDRKDLTKDQLKRFREFLSKGKRASYEKKRPPGIPSRKTRSHVSRRFAEETRRPQRNKR